MTTAFALGGSFPVLSVTRAGVVVTEGGNPPPNWPGWFGGILRYVDHNLRPGQVSLFRGPRIDTVRYACVFCGTVFPLFAPGPPRALKFETRDHPEDCAIRKDVDRYGPGMFRLFDPLLPIFPDRGESITKQIVKNSSRIDRNQRVQSFFVVLEREHRGTADLTLQQIGQEAERIASQMAEADRSDRESRAMVLINDLQTIVEQGSRGVRCARAARERQTTGTDYPNRRDVSSGSILWGD